MSQNQILNWIGAISGLSTFIFLLLFLIITFSMNYKKKSKFKKILCSNVFNEITGAEAQLEKNVEKYFKEIFIKDIDRNLFKKFFTAESGIGKKPTKIAWEFFLILTTSVLANDSQGKVSEAVISLKNVFDESKKILLSSDNGNLITDIILKVMNLKIRPILVSSRLLVKIDTSGNSTIKDEDLDENAIKNFWKQITKLRKDLIENKYLYFISVLSLAGHTSEQINTLLNYPSNHKMTEAEIQTETEINESIEIIKAASKIN